MKHGSLEWKSIASVKAPVIVGFVILWNLGCLIAVIFNGGFGSINDPTAARIMSFTCICACAFALLVATSSNAQDLLLAPKRRHNFRKDEFLFIALVTGVLAVISFAVGMGEIATNDA